MPKCNSCCKKLPRSAFFASSLSNYSYCCKACKRKRSRVSAKRTRQDESKRMSVNATAYERRQGSDATVTKEQVKQLLALSDGKSVTGATGKLVVARLDPDRPLCLQGTLEELNAVILTSLEARRHHDGRVPLTQAHVDKARNLLAKTICPQDASTKSDLSTDVDDTAMLECDNHGSSQLPSQRCLWRTCQH